MDVPTFHTHSFVAETIGREPRRLLEIGCGDGRLAKSLTDRGHSVVALDENPEAVAFARDLGIDVRLATWPDGDVGSAFDVVLFTRSLHHLTNLVGSLERAREILQLEGTVIVEDFDWHGADAELIHWFVSQLREAVETGLVKTEDQFPWTLLDADDPVTVWRNDQRRSLHTAETMEQAIEKSFSIEKRGQTPYLFRYLGEAIDDPCGRRTTQERMLNGERLFATNRGVSMLGRRWCAK